MGFQPDAVVVGSGPNGLVAAITLARAGFRVLVLEANPERPGGAMATLELTLPSFQHDFGPGFFPFAQSSPAFKALELEKEGVSFGWAKYESCHVALDGSAACLARSEVEPHAPFGADEDTEAWQRLAGFYQKHEAGLLSMLLGPPSLGAWRRLGFLNTLKLLSIVGHSVRSLSEKRFASVAARRVLPALALHADVGPSDAFGAATGYMLGAAASSGGFPVAIGGAGAITNALVTQLERHGGRLWLGERVVSVKSEKGRVLALSTDKGNQIGPLRAVVATTGVKSLLLDLVERGDLSERVLHKAKRFRHGWGTFKLDYALSGKVPWRIEEATESAVVHTGEDVEDLERFTREVRRGELPSRPYLVIGQQSLIDPTRAPANQHTLYVYTHVPSRVEGGWGRHAQRLGDVIEARIEALAPGFRQKIKARAIQTPDDLERYDANLVGGDLAGGSAAITQQWMLRPFFPHYRYRMPIRGLYLGSSSAHPGGGVHGMCGFNAACQLIRDIG